LSLLLKLELDRCIGMPMYIGRYGDAAGVPYRQNSVYIYGHKSRYAIVLHGEYGKPNYNSLPCSLRHAALRLHTVFPHLLAAAALDCKPSLTVSRTK